METRKKRLGIGTALFIIIMLTAALAGLLYFSHQWLGSSFVPVDLFEWLTRTGVNTWNSLVENLNGIQFSNGVEVDQALKVTTTLLSLGLFFTAALIVGLVTYGLWGRRGHAPTITDGVIAGVILAVPMIFAGMAVDGSTLPVLINLIWLLLLFLGWGIGLSLAFKRAMLPALPPVILAVSEGETDATTTLAADETPIETTELPKDQVTDSRSVEGVEIPPVASRQPAEPDNQGIDRRQFLLRFGASTAAIAVGSAVAGSALAHQEMAAKQPGRPLPVASPEFLEAQRELFGTFRRFVIVHNLSDGQEQSNVIALGAEYPDRNYVSVWIGERSPIVIYENLDSALVAFGSPTGPADILWLDS